MDKPKNKAYRRMKTNIKLADFTRHIPEINASNSMTRSQVADYLSLSTATIKRWTDSGRIESVRASPTAPNYYPIAYIHALLKDCAPLALTVAEVQIRSVPNALLLTEVRRRRDAGLFTKIPLTTATALPARTRGGKFMDKFTPDTPRDYIEVLPVPIGSTQYRCDYWGKQTALSRAGVLSQAELADLVGVSRQVVRDMESAGELHSTTLLDGVAKVYPKGYVSVVFREYFRYKTLMAERKATVSGMKAVGQTLHNI